MTVTANPVSVQLVELQWWRRRGHRCQHTVHAASDFDKAVAWIARHGRDARWLEEAKDVWFVTYTLPLNGEYVDGYALEYYDRFGCRLVTGEPPPPE